jgi:hypothetical protein
MYIFRKQALWVVTNKYNLDNTICVCVHAKITWIQNKFSDTITKYETSNDHVTKAVLLMRTHALLHLVEGTVTSSFAAALRHAYCGPPLVEYIRTKNQWSLATVESINWQAHGSALISETSRKCGKSAIAGD